MSTRSCPACSNIVSIQAKTCPHCGHPLTVGRSGFEGLKDLVGCTVQIIVVGFFFFLFIGLIVS